MNKKPIDLDKTNPFRIPDDGPASHNIEHSNAKSLPTALSSDTLPGSQALPARINLFQRINIKILIGIFFVLLIISLIIYYMAGYGRKALDKSIIGLIGSGSIPTVTTDPTRPTIVKNSPVPSETPRITPTSTNVAFVYVPTVISPTITVTNKPTIPPTSTLTPTPACWDVNSISLADVGQTRCVSGTVLETIEKATNFLVIFSHKRGALYWISYDLAWTSSKVGTCYRTTGRIENLGDNPVLIFDYSNLPEICP